MKRLTKTQSNLLVLAVLLALLVGVEAWQRARDARTENASVVSNFSLTSPVLTREEAAKASAVPTSAATNDPDATIPTMSYGKAVNAYGDTRFQFVNCAGTPGSIIVKKGSVVMLDNRDNRKRTIAVGSKSYAIDAYDFRLILASELGNLAVTCDGGGAGTLTVKP